MKILKKYILIALNIKKENELRPLLFINQEPELVL